MVSNLNFKSIRKETEVIIHGCLVYLAKICIYQILESQAYYIIHINQFQSGLMNRLFKNAVEFPETKAKLVEGALPTSVKGLYFRNCPGKLSYGSKTLNHWFFGNGALLKVELKNSECFTTMKYAQTPAKTYCDLQQSPRVGFLTRTLKSMNNKDFFNPTNTSVHIFSGSQNFLALCQGGRPFLMSKNNLSSMGHQDYGWMGSAAFSAHPKVDPQNGDIYNVGMNIPHCMLMRADKDMNKICTQELKLRSFQSLHDFCIAGDYLVAFQYPLQFSMPKMIIFNSFMKASTFRHDWPTIAHVYKRHTLEHVKSFDLPPFYCFHFTNGFQEGNKLVIQFFKYGQQYVQNLFQFLEDVPKSTQGFSKDYRIASTLDELTINLDDFSFSFDNFDINGEFPICSDSLVSKKFKYSYMVSTHSKGKWGFFDQIYRFDRQTKEKIIHQEPGVYFNEPALIESPEKSYLLAVQNKYQQDKSYICLFEADTMKKVCSFETPQYVPPGFHGKWENLP